MKKIFENFRNLMLESEERESEERISSLSSKLDKIAATEREFEKNAPPVPSDIIGAEVVLLGEYMRVYNGVVGDLSEKDFNELRKILMKEYHSSDSKEEYIEAVFHPVRSMSRDDVLTTTISPRHHWAEVRKNLSIKLFQIWAEKTIEDWPTSAKHWGIADEKTILNKLGKSPYRGYSRMKDHLVYLITNSWLKPGKAKRGSRKEAKISIVQAKSMLEDLSKKIYMSSLLSGTQGYIVAMKALEEVE